MKKFIQKSRKGFTLIELLIVIIILGVLSATMMMSSGTSVAAARAEMIISNMNTIKNAALSYFTAEYASHPTLKKFVQSADVYLGATALTTSEWKDNAANVLSMDKFIYGVYSHGDATDSMWLVYCDYSGFDKNGDAADIREKLVNAASSAQLFDDWNGTVLYKKTSNYKVYMRIK